MNNNKSNQLINLNKEEMALISGGGIFYELGRYARKFVCALSNVEMDGTTRMKMSGL